MSLFHVFTPLLKKTFYQICDTDGELICVAPHISSIRVICLVFDVTTTFLHSIQFKKNCKSHILLLPSMVAVITFCAWFDTLKWFYRISYLFDFGQIFICYKLWSLQEKYFFYLSFSLPLSFLLSPTLYIYLILSLLQILFEYGFLSIVLSSSDRFLHSLPIRHIVDLKVRSTKDHVGI